MIVFYMKTFTNIVHKQEFNLYHFEKQESPFSLITTLPTLDFFFSLSLPFLFDV